MKLTTEKSDEDKQNKKSKGKFQAEKILAKSIEERKDEDILLNSKSRCRSVEKFFITTEFTFIGLNRVKGYCEKIVVEFNKVD
ncbi:CLUMA_CG013438, isoform A [Clunio marinus]|uniref:CLUMA_CG013438, isoform A n=1 Tax=Clunio marinus TaxID=568069 RepID=A0A1J1IK78_9DIPT|nr:CLUMA_CG013438, isoform A [Clunio marinus]